MSTICRSFFPSRYRARLSMTISQMMAFGAAVVAEAASRNVRREQHVLHAPERRGGRGAARYHTHRAPRRSDGRPQGRRRARPVESSVPRPTLTSRASCFMRRRRVSVRRPAVPRRIRQTADDDVRLRQQLVELRDAAHLVKIRQRLPCRAAHADVHRAEAAQAALRHCCRGRPCRG